MKKEKPAKSTNAEMELRLKQVYSMIIEGYGRRQIIQYASATWGITERQTDTYLKRVHEQIQEDFGEQNRIALINKQLAKLQNLYHANRAEGKFDECRLIIGVENKMLGLNEAEKVEVDAKQSITINEVKQYKDKI